MEWKRGQAINAVTETRRLSFAAAKLSYAAATISENAMANEAFRELVAQGCDPLAILTNLFYYCGGTAEDQRLGLKAALEFRDRLEWLAIRLVEDAEWVLVTREKLMKCGIQISGTGFDDLPARLIGFAERLAILVGCTRLA